MVKKKINSRSKGQRGEREVAKIFSAWWGSDFTRTPSSGGFRTKEFRDDWNAAGDLVTPDPTFPFCVECKSAQGWYLDQLLTAPKSQLHKWWDQTKGETPEGKLPLLVFKKNHSPWFFMMRLEDWCNWTVTREHIVFNREGEVLVVGLLELFCKNPAELWKK